MSDGDRKQTMNHMKSIFLIYLVQALNETLFFKKCVC